MNATTAGPARIARALDLEVEIVVVTDRIRLSPGKRLSQCMPGGAAVSFREEIRTYFTASTARTLK